MLTCLLPKIHETMIWKSKFCRILWAALGVMRPDEIRCTPAAQNADSDEPAGCRPQTKGKKMVQMRCSSKEVARGYHLASTILRERENRSLVIERRPM